MKRVLVAGATGYLGRHVVDELKRRGHWVRVLVRRPEQQRPFAATADDVVLGQVTRPETIRDVAKGVDTVITTIGITRQQEGFTYEEVDYRGNLHVLREAMAAGVDRFVYVGLFGAERLEHVAMVRAKERFARALIRAPIDHCIIRPTAFFVDLEAVVDMARQGRILLLGDGTQRVNPISGADLARAICEATQQGKDVLEVGGPVVYTLDEIAEAAFGAIGRPSNIWHIPRWIGALVRRVLRLVTPVRFYGPIEFFIEVTSMSMVAPAYGSDRVEDFFAQCAHRVHRGAGSAEA